MSNTDIIRAWKDEDYRATLTEEQRSRLPAHPAGAIAIDDDDLDSTGGTTSWACGVVLGTASQTMSCWPSCGNTMWQGTCGVGSVGCCGEAVT